MDVEITFCFLLQPRLPLIDHIITLFKCHQYPDQGLFWCFLLPASLFLFTYRWFCGFTSCVISELWAWDLKTWSPITSAFVTFFGMMRSMLALTIAVWALSKFSPWSLAESHYPAEWLWHMREERGQWSGLAVCCACYGPVSYLLWDFGQIIWSPPSSICWWTFCCISWVAQRPPETPGSSSGSQYCTLLKAET